MPYLKRIHLADVSMTSEQAIALAEVLPEVPQLAHISLQDNPELAKLADARTEEAQEEACALYASLLAAVRVSKTLVSVEIDVPSEESSEVVKALAKQVVAYCLRNMERLQVGDLEDAGITEAAVPYPDVLAHLVGREETGSGELDALADTAPDDDYVIGGTGVVKALACCLDNKGDESRRASLDSAREVGSEVAPQDPSRLPSGRARNMSKHLLSSARKIRARLQPALARAKEHSEGREEDLRKLIFLEYTLNGIIKRFEDEFPETREVAYGSPWEAGAAEAPLSNQESVLPPPDREDSGLLLSDPEDDDNALHVRPISRSSSLHAHTKPLDLEEGRMHRRGHRFRTSIIHPFEKYEEVLVASLDEMGENPKHLQMLRDMIEDLNDPVLDAAVAEKGPVRTFKEDKERVAEKLRAVDPEHWEKFRESQVMARKNINVDESWLARITGEAATAVTDPKNESAIE